MSYYLVISIVVAIIAVVYMWYMTRGINSIPDTTILMLNTTDNYLLADWYKHYTKPSFAFNTNECEVAARLLERLYDIQVNPNLIVIGNDLASKYNTLTHRHLSVDVTNTNVDTIYDIRSAVGVNTEISLIHNHRLRNELRRITSSDSFNEIYPIVESELEIIARDYLKQVMKYRWDKIMELNDNRVINNNGTFLYMRECNIPNIETTITSIGIRINLLCTNLEFETLIQRWTRELITSKSEDPMLLF